jgi:hypothetical protein
MKYITNFGLITIFILAIFTSCDDTGITDIVFPDKNVSYKYEVQPLFNKYCNNSGCHNSQDNAGEISLETYGDLFATPFLIIKYSPEESHLYLAISGKLVNIMPPPYGNSFPLNDNQINGIKTWITEGAEAD